jgi:hypothetical protein
MSWEFAEANDIVVHIHPPMLSVGYEVLMQRGVPFVPSTRPLTEPG